MEATEMALENSPKHLSAIAAALSIAAIVLAAFFWVFNVNSKADLAKDQASKNAQQLELKADKSEVKADIERILDKLDKINDYMLRQNERRR